MLPCYCISQSFDLPLSPHQSVIWLVHCHHVTALVSQSFDLPLPPHQSVIWLALHHCITALLCQSVIWLSHCHHISQSFGFPSTTVTMLLHQSVIWHAVYHCVTMSLCYHSSQSFDLPTATTSVSHLPSITVLPCHCISHLTFPLPSHQSVIWLAL